MVAVSFAVGAWDVVVEKELQSMRKYYYLKQTHQFIFICATSKKHIYQFDTETHDCHPVLPRVIQYSFVIVSESSLILSANHVRICRAVAQPPLLEKRTFCLS